MTRTDRRRGDWRLRPGSYMDEEPEVLELQLGTIVGSIARRWLDAAWRRPGEEEAEQGEREDAYDEQDRTT